MLSLKQIVEKVMAMEFLDVREGSVLFSDFPLSGLIALGHTLRLKLRKI